MHDFPLALYLCGAFFFPLSIWFWMNAQHFFMCCSKRFLFGGLMSLLSTRLMTVVWHWCYFPFSSDSFVWWNQRRINKYNFVWVRAFNFQYFVGIAFSGKMVHNVFLLVFVHFFNKQYQYRLNWILILLINVLVFRQLFRCFLFAIIYFICYVFECV